MKHLLILFIAAVLASVMTFRTSPARLQDFSREKEAPSRVLQGAIAYINTRPVYRSRYYAGGWPDDGCGTCTDLAGFALLSCGYDLREKVHADILLHRERYAIEEPDINIDFRRVRNLIPYFQYNAIVLTNDLSEQEEWQGGDLVLFRNHIGVVSDRRNPRGTPYVIHHYGSFQMRYEEDILETRNDLVLHVRVLP